ncbi:MAG TPA: universal stress protein [Polyangia bacterium]|nr:universal stress protein [Polyangia bacterium]
MYTLRPVSVPHDFAECARLALDYAAFLNEPVEVLHEWQGPRWGHEDPEPLVLFARSRDRRELEECLVGLARRCPSRGRLTGAGGCHVTIRVGGADNYDLIVMGSHGSAKKTTLLMGQVAKKLAGQGIELGDARLAVVRVAELGSAPSQRQLTRTHKMTVLPSSNVPRIIGRSDSEPHSE